MLFSCKNGNGKAEYVGPPGDILMIHLYVFQSDVSVIRQGYSTTTGCLWLRIHDGIEISTQKDRALIHLGIGAYRSIIRFQIKSNGFPDIFHRFVLCQGPGIDMVCARA